MPTDHLMLAAFTIIFLAFIALAAVAVRIMSFLLGFEAPLLFQMYLPESVTSSGLLMLLVHLTQLMVAVITRIGLMGAQLHFMVLVALATKNLEHLNSVLRTLQSDK